MAVHLQERDYLQHVLHVNQACGKAHTHHTTRPTGIWLSMIALRSHTSCDSCVSLELAPEVVAHLHRSNQKNRKEQMEAGR